MEPRWSLGGASREPLSSRYRKSIATRRPLYGHSIAVQRPQEEPEEAVKVKTTRRARESARTLQEGRTAILGCRRKRAKT